MQLDEQRWRREGQAPMLATMSATIVWLHRDLRLEDNPALHAAIERGQPVIPALVWAPDDEAPWAPGSASRWWLHQSLAALGASLRDRGSRLVLRTGPTLEALRSLVRETGADAVHWNRRHEPALVERDATIMEALTDDGLQVETFNASLLFEPWDVETQQGKPYQVFTPFWRRCRGFGLPTQTQPSPEAIPALRQWPVSASLEGLDLLPRVDWTGGLGATWAPGEAGAQERLEAFVDEILANYGTARDRPSHVGTSRLSPHLRAGEIGPRQIVKALAEEARLADGTSADTYLSQLGWREFAHHVLYHFPSTPDRPLKSTFETFPWQEDATGLQAWQRGETGYPMVDAGMRELWATGWMHNRVRMVAASFLTKDLLVPWQSGARWFWDTLVDADLANNTLGWQWAAGCGADAAPYFRIFNPVRQGERFDPDGAYVRQWVPELADLDAKLIHAPWQASDMELQAAGVALGETYPEPIVDHREARDRALAAYDRIKEANG